MKNKLSYFIAKSSMFGIGFFLLFKDNGKNSWLSIILGTLIGIIIIFFYHLIKKELHNKKITAYLKESKIGKLYLIIFIIFYMFLIIIILLILAIFVNSFYLLNTPKLLIALPFLILASYLAYKEDYILTNLSNLIFYISMILVIIFSLLLIPYIDYTELMPYFNYQVVNVLKGSFIYASITSIPQILIIDFDKKFVNTLKNYITASVINLIIVLGTILALGNTLIKVYNFPEYAVLKQIKILDFIENIENMSALGWYFELFMLLSLTVTKLKEALPKKKNPLYLLILLIISTYISIIIFDSNYALTLKLFYYYPIILLIFFIIFISLFIYLRLKKNNT